MMVNRIWRIIEVLPHNFSVSAYTEMQVRWMQRTAILRQTTPPTTYIFTNAFVSYPSYIFPPSRPSSRVPLNTKRRLSKLLHYLLQSMHADTFSDIWAHHIVFMLRIYFIATNIYVLMTFYSTQRCICVLMTFYSTQGYICPDDILQYTTLYVCPDDILQYARLYMCPDDILQYTRLYMCPDDILQYTRLYMCPDDILQYTRLCMSWWHSTVHNAVYVSWWHSTVHKAIPKDDRERRNTQERSNSKCIHKSVPCWLYCLMKLDTSLKCIKTTIIRLEKIDLSEYVTVFSTD
jgi:hypothetical protein